MHCLVAFVALSVCLSARTVKVENIELIKQKDHEAKTSRWKGRLGLKWMLAGVDRYDYAYSSSRHIVVRSSPSQKSNPGKSGNRKTRRPVSNFFADFQLHGMTVFNSWTAVIVHAKKTSPYKTTQSLKAVTRGVFWVFEHPRNFWEKLDTQKQIRRLNFIL